jgi:hypothetical protein
MSNFLLAAISDLKLSPNSFSIWGFFLWIRIFCWSNFHLFISVLVATWWGILLCGWYTFSLFVIALLYALLFFFIEKFWKKNKKRKLILLFFRLQLLEHSSAIISALARFPNKQFNSARNPGVEFPANSTNSTPFRFGQWLTIGSSLNNSCIKEELSSLYNCPVQNPFNIRMRICYSFEKRVAPCS